MIREGMPEKDADDDVPGEEGKVSPAVAHTQRGQTDQARDARLLHGGDDVACAVLAQGRTLGARSDGADHRLVSRHGGSNIGHIQHVATSHREIRVFDVSNLFRTANECRDVVTLI